jgi:hypothetical protein
VNIKSRVHLNVRRTRYSWTDTVNCRVSEVRLTLSLPRFHGGRLSKGEPVHHCSFATGASIPPLSKYDA